MPKVTLVINKPPTGVTGAKIIAHDHGMHIWGQTGLQKATLITIENDKEVTLIDDGGGSFTLTLS